jgi:uncharacterized protein (TIGR03083 family)
MDVARLAEGLHVHTEGLAKAVAGADPDAIVPTCPEWPLRVLIGHIGQAHRWTASIVRSGPSPVPDPFDADPGEPGEWAGWLRAGATDLIDAVQVANGPVWTFFGPGQGTFWLRRMLHDTIVHHADAAFATGNAFDVAPDLATDAISEWLEVLTNPVTQTLRPALAELRGTGQRIQVRPETGPGWLITRFPDGVRWSRSTDAADATLTGSVANLLLVLSRRRPLSEVAITGDRDLVDHWLAHTSA